MSKISLQLVTNGKVIGLYDLGFASPVQAHSYIEPEIARWLQSPDNYCTGLEILKANLWQGLLNRSLRDFHGYRLVWGWGNPEDKFSAYPNGVSLDWHLVRFTNGKVIECLSGSLPDNWHGLSQDERQCLIEDRFAV